MPRWFRYAAPYFAALCAVAITTGMSAVLLRTPFPRVTYGLMFLVVILGSAWWGGYGPGIMATLLILLGAPFIVIPNFTWSKINGTQLVLLLLVSALVSRIAAGRNEREAMLREANERLDERVRQRTGELERVNASLQEREATLLRQADELVRSNADLQQFAYLASHDLQEPLRMIAIYTQLLQRRYRGQLDAEADQFITVVVDGVHRLESLIRDLLTYSRTIHEQAPAEREPVDLGEVLGAATANLDMVMRECQAKVEWESLPNVPGQRAHLTQVFQNLLSNAIKYRGNEPPRIRVSAMRDRREWVVTVRDNGIGIHPDYHEMIFNPFKRLHGQEYAGTGIGLAICRRVVERQGGRIWVESEPGRGAAFLFTIPLESPQPAARAAAELSGFPSSR